VYLVAAASTHQGPPAIHRPGASPGTSSVLPVGVCHAVLAPPDDEGYRFALCGCSVAGWVIMTGTVFTPEHPASCRRCAQLVLSARQRAAEQPDRPHERPVTPNESARVRGIPVAVRPRHPLLGG
jgi:hypothetical protein